MAEREQDIRRLAETAADKMFAHQSFRWQKVVEVYTQAINEWTVHCIQKANMDTDRSRELSMPQPSHDPNINH